MTARLRVATLNLRNIMDRWEERLPLLLADVGALRADLLGLQEVVFAVQQDRLLGAAGPDRYSIERCPAGRPEYGNATLAKAPLELDDVERIDLGRERAALRARIALADDTTLLFVVTHLHHEVGGADVREGQVVALLDWLERAPSTDAQVVVGDFNANPGEPACTRMEAAGFRSAYREANGEEPRKTWPSGLNAPAIDTDGPAACLDYVWVRGPARVETARLFCDRPAVGDPTLYPSDHLGVTAELSIG